MSKIFKPRRGKASTMNGTKSSTVLAAGEMFIELPDTGVGTGICKMKMGDGVTAYSSLPYAMGGDIASTEITGSIVEDTSETAKAALQNVTTGRTLGAIIGSLRQACKLNEAAISKLNDDLYTRPKLDKYTVGTGKTIRISPVLSTIITAVSSNSSNYAVFVMTGYSTDSIRSAIARLTTSNNYGELQYINENNAMNFKNTNQVNGASVFVLHLYY